MGCKVRFTALAERIRHYPIRSWRVLYFSAVDRCRGYKGYPKLSHCDYLGYITSILGYLIVVEGPTVTFSTQRGPVAVTRSNNLWDERSGTSIRSIS
jgi:hypothetical protein